MAVVRFFVAVCTVALLAPAGASAGTVTLAGGVLTFTAGSGEVNHVTVSQPGGPDTDYQVRDTGPAPQTSEPGCTVVADTVSCASAGVTGIRVLLGDLNDDAGLGIPGTLDGGDDGDVLTGSAAADVLLGGRGDDALTGAGGADDLRGERGDDDLDGGAGADTLDGGAGDDVISGGADADDFDAGPGNDVLALRDGAVDTGACGTESDLATVDFADALAADCETVDRSPDPNPTPASTPTPAATQTPTPDAGPAPQPAPDPSPSPPSPTATPVRDRSAPVVLVSTRSIRVDSRGRFRVVLVAANEAAVGDIVADTAGSPRLRLGRSVFVLRPRARTPVRIKLTAAGARVLRRARGRAVPIRVIVKARDAAGNAVQVTVRLRLKLRR